MNSASRLIWPTFHAYEVGDIVQVKVPRSWWEVWGERLRTGRWNVPLWGWRQYECTGTYPGAMWPEVR